MNKKKKGGRKYNAIYRIAVYNNNKRYSTLLKIPNQIDYIPIESYITWLGKPSSQHITRFSSQIGVCQM